MNKLVTKFKKDNTQKRKYEFQEQSALRIHNCGEFFEGNRELILSEL